MFTHVVLFRLKPEAKTQASALVAQARAMKGRIPELEDIEVGVDVVHSARSYDIALIARLADKSALERYAVHPVHQELLQVLTPAVESSVAVDFLTE
ncbi:stress responsive protein [Alicyclobacillus contaminans]|uniref:Dabb family protein n=1 Tax=Alicyclobacillus contaminans TaxID=392016 RepID=UPI000405BA2D|nr:Dabb family protein [Alicyclobacillus contaminans]GMA52215.1 stress responsive protein [Alicyclobacillus contaminans]